METGLRKELPSGTVLDFLITSDRDESNSNFVDVNPSFFEKAELTLTQPLLANAFGMVDRLRIRETVLDVQRFNYETLQKIQDALLQTRRAYWKAREANQILMIRKMGLRDDKSSAWEWGD